MSVEITGAEFIADTANAFRLAREHGYVHVVDEDGVVTSVLSCGGTEDDEDDQLHARLKAAEAVVEAARACATTGESFDKRLDGALAAYDALVKS